MKSHVRPSKAFKLSFDGCPSRFEAPTRGPYRIGSWGGDTAVLSLLGLSGTLPAVPGLEDLNRILGVDVAGSTPDCGCADQIPVTLALDKRIMSEAVKSSAKHLAGEER